MNSSIYFKTYGIALILIFLFLSGRLWQLQVVSGDKYADLSRRNAVRLLDVPAPRGVIYDSTGVPIVTSRMAYRISLDIRDVKDPNHEYPKLMKLLKMTPKEMEERLSTPRRRSYEPVVLMTDADAVTVSKVLEHKTELPGVTVGEFPTRQYVYGNFASHLLGYISEISPEELADQKYSGYRMGDLIGKTGLEKVYEPYLKGISGGLQVEVNNHGEPIKVLGTKDPIPGNDIVLTLNYRLQKATERVLEEHMAALRSTGEAPNAKAGVAIAMDPKTGRILAMASKPDFSPNSFVKRSERYKLTALFNDKLHPFSNRAIAGLYPYGSTFKMVTSVAALEEGKVGDKDRFYCRKYDPTYSKMKCMGYHGYQDLISGIKNSCNIVFYELGRRVGVDTLAKWARNFGFGAATGIEIPGEAKGLVPTSEWKRTISPYRWYFTETMSFAIGQGYLNGTPLQLAVAYSALVNGGLLYTPQVVDRIVNPEGTIIKKIQPIIRDRIYISPENLKVIKEGLRQVCAIGTARRAFAGFPIPVAGKSGTAQNAGDDHGWFAAYAPADDPDIVVVALVEHGKSGSHGAAPIARKMLETYFNIKSSSQGLPAGPVIPD